MPPRISGTERERGLEESWLIDLWIHGMRCMGERNKAQIMQETKNQKPKAEPQKTDSRVSVAPKKTLLD